MTSIRNLFLCLLAMLLANVTYAASLYKWTDAEGNVHFSQTPPQDNQAERMRLKPLPKTNQGTTAAASEAPEENAGEKTTAEKKPQTIVDEQMAQNCEIARSNLANYQKFRKVRQPDGEVVTLDEESRQEKISEAQQMIDRFCK